MVTNVNYKGTLCKTMQYFRCSNDDGGGGIERVGGLGWRPCWGGMACKSCTGYPLVKNSYFAL